MHNINDDIDELLRRAAENYPLKTDGADWNKVFSALDSEQPPVAPASKSNNGYRLLVLLFFLSLPMVCDYFIQNQSGRTAFSPAGAIQAPATVVPVPVNDTETAGNKTSGASKQEATEGSRISLTRVARQKENNHPSITYKQSNNPNRYRLKQAAQDITTSSRQSGVGRETVSQNQPAGSFTETEKRMPGNVSTTVAVNNTSPVASHPADTASNSLAQSSMPSVQKADTTVTQTQPQQPEEKQPAARSAKAFYLSVVAGPDASTIKLQSIEAGYNVGVVAGYRFHKKWMVEAGALWSKKSYYTDAKHMNTSKIYAPANTKLRSADGDCYMIEVPVAIRYDFRTTERRNWFAALGLSSYIMKKESYEYTYDAPTGAYDYYKTYRNATTNLFSVAYLGVGLQQSIGKTTSIRLEPYLKMPLKGLGVLSLPFSSAGFTVGVTKRIF